MTSLDDVLRLIGVAGPASSFESEDLDFKRPGRDVRHTLELLADAAVCFANAKGGTVVLGVDDKAVTRPEALLGVEPSLSVDAIRKGIHERTRPKLDGVGA